MGCCSSKKPIEAPIPISKRTIIQDSAAESRLNSPKTLNKSFLTSRRSISPQKQVQLKNMTQMKIIEYPYSVFRRYTMIDIGYVNILHQRVRLVTLQHNLSGKTKFCRVYQTQSNEEVPNFVQQYSEARINHPNISTIYEIYNERRNWYLIENYCNYGPLKKIAEDYKWQIPQLIIATLVKGMLQSISYLHNRALYHSHLTIESFLIHKEGDTLRTVLVDLESLFTKENHKSTNVILYSSPEQFDSKYYFLGPIYHTKYEKGPADIWSIGAIMYYLITGKHPIKLQRSPVQDGMEEGIPQHHISFDEEFAFLSKSGLDLLKKMLAIDPNQRPTAQECLRDPWFTLDQLKVGQKQKQQLASLLQKSLKPINRIQTGILLYMAQNYYGDQIKTLNDMFNEIDQDKNQTLNKEELTNLYIELNGQEQINEIKEKVDNIFDCLDEDKNGTIGFEEFLLATIDKKKLITEKNLQQTFKMIDIEKRNKISIQEFLKVIRGSEQEFIKIFKQIDHNHDGYLEFYEFKNLMFQLLD